MVERVEAVRSYSGHHFKGAAVGSFPDRRSGEDGKPDSRPGCHMRVGGERLGFHFLGRSLFLWSTLPALRFLGHVFGAFLLSWVGHLVLNTVVEDLCGEIQARELPLN